MFMLLLYFLLFHLHISGIIELISTSSLCPIAQRSNNSSYSSLSQSSITLSRIVYQINLIVWLLLISLLVE